MRRSGVSAGRGMGDGKPVRTIFGHVCAREVPAVDLAVRPVQGLPSRAAWSDLVVGPAAQGGFAMRMFFAIGCVLSVWVGAVRSADNVAIVQDRSAQYAA